MKTSTWKKALATILTATTVAASLAACGSSDGAQGSASAAGSDSSSAAADSSAADSSAADNGATESDVADSTSGDGVTVIKAATGGSPKPYITVDENDELTGYDIEVLKAAFELLPEYELEIEITDFTSVFTGLTAGNYQIGVNNFSYNAERAENYLYSVPYDEISYVFVYKNGADPITSFASAAGKTFENGAGVSVTNAVEQWNEKNPDEAINITYSDADTAVWLQHVEDGSVDFSIIDGPMYTAYIDEYGFDLGKAEIPEDEASLISDNLYAYFILPKDQTELRDKLDAAILELKQNGTLKELSEEFFGGADQSPAEEALLEPLN